MKKCLKVKIKNCLPGDLVTGHTSRNWGTDIPFLIVSIIDLEEIDLEDTSIQRKFHILTKERKFRSFHPFISDEVLVIR